MPFTGICRRLFYEGCWPEAWKLHLIVPIYKKGSAFQPGNYRGVHLTSILSKLAEKVIGARLTPFLRMNAFGKNQWAFSSGLGARSTHSWVACPLPHEMFIEWNPRAFMALKMIKLRSLLFKRALGLPGHGNWQFAPRILKTILTATFESQPIWMG